MYNLYVTIGPSSFNQDTIKKLDNAGATLFRINMSHTNIDDLEYTIKTLQDWSSVPVCIDSEGAQIRNRVMRTERQFFNLHSEIEIFESDEMIGDSSMISLVPPGIVGQLE